MKITAIPIALTLATLAGAVHADGQHDKWVIIESMSSPIFRSVPQAQQQAQKVGRLDTGTPAGRRAEQLVREGKRVQQELMKLRSSKEIPPAKAEQLSGKIEALIKGMDRNKPAEGTQGACFSSCDNAYGSGFGGGKGWNRFWCKASCFKINVNVGGADKGNNPPGNLTQGTGRTRGLLVPAVQSAREAARPSQPQKGKVESEFKVEKGE